MNLSSFPPVNNNATLVCSDKRTFTCSSATSTVSKLLVEGRVEQKEVVMSRGIRLFEDIGRREGRDRDAYGSRLTSSLPSTMTTGLTGSLLVTLTTAKTSSTSVTYKARHCRRWKRLLLECRARTRYLPMI